MSKCLIVTDFQNDFVTGSLGFPEARLLEEPIVEKIRQYRKNGDEVIFTFDTHHEDYLDTLEGRNLPIVHCLEELEGWKVYGKVADEVKETDKKFNKSCFGSDELFVHLRKTQYMSIELVGLVSNICVLANAVLAKTAQPETPIIIDKNCTASFDKELHEAAMKVMAGLQIEVVA